MAIPFALAGAVSEAQPNYRVIYSGLSDEIEILAVSVSATITEAELDQLAESLLGGRTRLLVYSGYPGFSSARPIAVYQNGERALLDLAAPREASGRTIQAEIDGAYRTGGRSGAICKDGSRSSATGRGACSHHGGVSRWLTSRVRDTGKTVATICADLRLTSGTDCGRVGRLAAISNRSYSVPTGPRGVSFLDRPAAVASPVPADVPPDASASEVMATGAGSRGVGTPVLPLPTVDVPRGAESEELAQLESLSVSWSATRSGRALQSTWELRVALPGYRAPREVGVNLLLLDSNGEPVWRHTIIRQLDSRNLDVVEFVNVDAEVFAAATSYAARILWTERR